MKNKKIRRIVSVVLIVAFVLGNTFTCFAASAPEKVVIDFEKVNDYAAKHWNDGKGYCAEFLSKCITAGLNGIKIKETGTGGLMRALLSTMKGISVPKGSDYTKYLTELKLNKNGQATCEKNQNVLHKNDVVCIYCKTHKVIIHVALCNGFNANGLAVYYAHNSAKNGGEKATMTLNSSNAYEHNSKCNIVGMSFCLHEMHEEFDVTFVDVATKDVNVLAKPSKDAKTVGTFKKGACVSVVSKELVSEKKDGSLTEYYKLSDGDYYIPAASTKLHKCIDSKCNLCLTNSKCSCYSSPKKYRVVKNSPAALHYGPAASSTLSNTLPHIGTGTVVEVGEKAVNTAGNTFFCLYNGNESLHVWVLSDYLQALK